MGMGSGRLMVAHMGGTYSATLGDCGYAQGLDQRDHRGILTVMGTAENHRHGMRQDGARIRSPMEMGESYVFSGVCRPACVMTQMEMGSTVMIGVCDVCASLVLCACNCRLFGDGGM